MDVLCAMSATSQGTGCGCVCVCVFGWGWGWTAWEERVTLCSPCVWCESPSVHHVSGVSHPLFTMCLV